MKKLLLLLMAGLVFSGAAAAIPLDEYDLFENIFVYPGISSVSEFSSPIKEQVLLVLREMIHQLENSPPENAEISCLTALTNKPKLKLSLSAWDRDNDPLTYQILSGSSIYETVSPEAEITLPSVSGDYTLLMYAFDGIAWSEPSKSIKVTLDLARPKILGANYPAVVNQEYFNITLFFSEPISNAIPRFTLANPAGSYNLTVDNFEIKGASLEARLRTREEGSFDLSFGNIFDLAGNSMEAVGAYKIKIDRQSPMVKIINPSAGTWYKPGSAILLEALVEDNQNDIPASPQINLLLDNQISGAKPSYNQALKKIYCFLPLKTGLSNGKHTLEIQIKDQLQNSGSAKAALLLDSTPPKILPPANPSGEHNEIVIPIFEVDSGIDFNASIVKVKFGSEEVAGQIKENAAKIIFVPNSTLKDGIYTLEVSLRDKAGNAAATEKISLAIEPFVIGASSVSKSSGGASLKYGPNPYNPGTGKFLASLSGSTPTETELFIFSITGKNIYRVRSTSTSLEWTGVDQFGLNVLNGVYPFILQAKDAAGNKDIFRGKIIVLR